MANIITIIRIVCSISLLFVPVFSPAFYVLYLIAGISDMIDGTIARKTGTASDFGSKLDTVADFILVTVCLIKLLPVLDIPSWLIVWIAVIALLKVINIISGYVMQQELVAVHTVMNKLTGIVLFLLPLTLVFYEFPPNYSNRPMPTISRKSDRTEEWSGFVSRKTRKWHCLYNTNYYKTMDLETERDQNAKLQKNKTCLLPWVYNAGDCSKFRTASFPKVS